MYSNSKEQVSLEEAYFSVHKTQPINDPELEQLTEGVLDIVQAGVDFVNDPHVRNLTGELIRWATIIGGSYITGKLFAGRHEAAQFIAELMQYSDMKEQIEQIRKDLKANDMKLNIQGHNRKVELLRLLDNWLIRKATKAGLLDDPNEALSILKKDVDAVEKQAAELRKVHT
jgi:inhibitor of KinA sporulation pathway (predicted exonuclease)